jgi:hypothetical protein
MNNTIIAYEYWDAELKNQSKKRLAGLDKAIAATGAFITDRHEDKYFEDKLKWRNPLLLKVILPKGKRWEFILASGCTVWLAQPPQVQIGLRDIIDRYNGTGDWASPPIPLRGNHDDAKTRRRYRLHPEHTAYIADYKPELNGGYEVIEGADIVSAVLGGDLDLLL